MNDQDQTSAFLLNTERKRTVKGCYEQLHANKLDKLDKMDKLLKRHKQQTLAEEEIENP